MPTKRVGSVYLVECKHFAPDVLRKWRDTLADTQKRSKVVRVKLLRILPGTRTYECEVVGATCTVKLSSKSLADLDASGSGPRTRHHSNSTEDDDGSVGDEEGS
jgi:hypothetical protein